MPIIQQKSIYDPSKGNPVEQLTKDLNLLVDVEKALIKQNKKLATSLQLVTKSNDGTEAKKLTEQTNKLATSTVKLKEVKTASIRVNEQLMKAQQRLAESGTKEAKELAKVNLQLQNNRKAAKEAATESLKLNNTYDKLVKNTNKAQKNFKNMAAQFGANSTQAKKARIEFDKLDNELRQVNNAAKDGRRDVGRYGTALKGVGRQLLGATGLIGGATLLVGAIKNGVKIFKDFDKSSSKLAAILSKTKDEISELTDQAKRLGATTAFTASEVISLQTELAKLGFTTNEIENSTEGILNLAAATGTDLASSAELAGATLRIFNLDASEMSRVTDVLAKSTTISSLSMEKLATILPTVGKTAEIAGLSLEQTAAFSGTLTDRGLDASSAATSLRNIFLELSKKGITWNDAMKQINTSTDKNKTSMDLFGKRAASAGVILSETAESTANLTTQLNESAGAAQEMADVMLDNLAGDITKAQSAWEGFILSLEDGNGVLSIVFRGVVQTGTGLLQMLTALNTEYINTATKAEEMNKSAKETIPLWNFQIKTLELLIPALKKAREETERIANLRAKRLTGLKNENDELKTFLFSQEILTGQQAAETRELIKKLKFKAQTNDLNKVENALLTTAIRKLGEYSDFQSLANEEDKKATTSKEALNKELDNTIKFLEKQRDTQRELNKEVDDSLGTGQVRSRGVTVDPIESLGTDFDPLAEAVDLTNQINEATAIAQEEANAEELQRVQDLEDAKLAIKEAALSAGTQFASDLFAQDQDDKLARIQADIEAEKALLQDKLDKGLISESEFKNKVAELNKKARIAEGRADKRKALFDIAIKTAVAAVAALPNLIKSAAIVVLGGIKAAAVAAKPLPSFKEGVIGFKGKGTTTSDSNPVNISNKESVITALGTSNAPLSLAAINSGLMSDADLINGGVNIPKANNQFNIDKMLKKQDKTNMLLSNMGWNYRIGNKTIIQRANGNISESYGS